MAVTLFIERIEVIDVEPLAGELVGQPARGTYTKTSDGKLAVTKVRFGKKTNSKAGGSGKGTGKKKSESTQ